MEDLRQNSVITVMKRRLPIQTKYLLAVNVIIIHCSVKTLKYIMRSVPFSFLSLLVSFPLSFSLHLPLFLFLCFFLYFSACISICRTNTKETVNEKNSWLLNNEYIMCVLEASLRTSSLLAWREKQIEIQSDINKSTSNVRTA
jgi:hypothetical protein